MALEVTGIDVSQSGRKMVTDISFSLNPGEVTAVLGANGAGKSELVRGLAGMLPVTAGRIVADGTDLTGRGPDTIRAAGVAVPREDLLPGSTAAEE